MGDIKDEHNLRDEVAQSFRNAREILIQGAIQMLVSAHRLEKVPDEHFRAPELGDEREQQEDGTSRDADAESIASSSTHTAPSVSTITSQPSRSSTRGRGRGRSSSTAIGHWLSRRSGHSRKLLRSELEEENTALREIVRMTMEHSADSGAGAEVGSHPVEEKSSEGDSESHARKLLGMIEDYADGAISPTQGSSQTQDSHVPDELE